MNFTVSDKVEEPSVINVNVVNEHGVKKKTSVVNVI